MLRDRPYLLLVATNYTYAISAMALNIAMPVYITASLGLPGWVAGAVFTINTVLIGLGQGLVVNAMQGSVRTNIIALGSLLSLVSYSILLTADATTVGIGVALVLIGAVVYTGGEIVAGPVLSALATDAAPVHLRGRYVSVYQMSWTVALTVAPVSLTWLLERGSCALWGALAGVALTGIVLSSHLRRVMPLAATAVPNSRPIPSPPQQPAPRHHDDAELTYFKTRVDDNRFMAAVRSPSGRASARSQWGTYSADSGASGCLGVYPGR